MNLIKFYSLLLLLSLWLEYYADACTNEDFNRRQMASQSRTPLLLIDFTNIYLSKFDKFSDLTCNTFFYLLDKHADIKTFILVPRNTLVLDETFQLENTFHLSPKNSYDLTIANVKGVKFFKKIHKKPLNRHKTSLFNLQTSKLEIYLDDEKTSTHECNTNTFQNRTSHMQSFSILAFNNVAYVQRGLCPLIFKSKMTQRILFQSIVNSLIIQNRLTFLDIENSSSTSSFLLPNLKVSYFL
jgi:hypothetical protein